MVHFHGQIMILELINKKYYELYLSNCYKAKYRNTFNISSVFSTLYVQNKMFTLRVHIHVMDTYTHYVYTLCVHIHVTNTYMHIYIKDLKH